jgi:Ca-activated chloride channel family protein
VVGIGSAPNRHFMEQAAAFGRGTFTPVGSPTEVEGRMTGLLAKLAQPVLSAIEVRWPDPAAEAWPERIPDLYAGEPVVVTARLSTVAGEVVVTGDRGVVPWEIRMPMAVGRARGGVHQLWARRKIAALEDRIAAGTPLEQVRAEVIQVALRHHLVSRFTSLVAVDVTPSRPRVKGLERRAVPTNLPHGWDYGHVFGQLPQGGTGARSFLGLGLLLLVVALAVRRVEAGWR